jgi:hypothetical protein
MVSVFAWVRPFTIAFDDVLAEFTTLKGANRKKYVRDKTYLFPPARPNIIMKIHETFLED